jgi:hypothetical protein
MDEESIGHEESPNEGQIFNNPDETFITGLPNQPDRSRQQAIIAHPESNSGVRLSDEEMM